jgi:hypothetical protein
MAELDHIRHPETQRPLSGCSAAAVLPLPQIQLQLSGSSKKT